MKITSFEVNGFLGRPEPIHADLHSTLAILTGRNGAGKTSLLKLMWYIISGNILLALREVQFSSATVLTTEYECTVHKLSSNTCKVEIVTPDKTTSYEDETDEDGDVYVNAEDAANSVLQGIGSSVFFPTFRRIEGGFGLNTIRSGFTGSRNLRPKGDVEEALAALSRSLTNESHTFVAAISTVDIQQLLLRQYADLSEQHNALQEAASKSVIQKIKDYRSDAGASHAGAEDVLDNIRAEIETAEAEREIIMKPIEEVRDQVERLITHTGVKFGSRLSFGDAASAVNSDLLSAGEKQMLSFICYNAFYRDSAIVIDEPELSLHVDWQRQLFTTLMGQQSSNQFIVATHSPFIYSKFPEFEVMVSPSRGDEA